MQEQQIMTAVNEMLQMQNALNNATNGDQWRSGVTRLGKPIDWRRCIVMETAELIDSYPWKHWKSVNAQVDIENVRVELVDIWHFLLSLALEHFSLEQAAKMINRQMQDADQRKIAIPEKTIEQVRIHEKMMVIALDASAVTEDYLDQLLQAFNDSCQVAELNFAQLYQIYMAKNVLNKFRQEHGYKEGSYIKEWHGKEDNIVMFEIIEQMSDFSGDQLYIRLKEVYSRIS